MRIDHLQQRLREGREFRFQLELDTRRQEGEAFQQPLDIGIGHLGAAEIEPGGDLGKFGGELAPMSRMKASSLS
jgi:hypothetical protein